MFTHGRILRARVKRAPERIVLHTCPGTSGALRLGPHGDVLRMHDGIADTGGLVCRSGSWEPRGTRQRWASRQESARLGMPLTRQPLLLHWRWARLAPATQNEANAAATVTAATAKAAKVIPAATPHSVKRPRQAPPRAARALAVWLANAPNCSASTSQERMRCAKVRGVVLTSSWPWCEQTQNSSRLSSWAYCYRACALCGA